MSSRRSARLSTVASSVAEAAVQPAKAPAVKVANIGKKRKTPGNDTSQTSATNDTSPSTPKKKKAKKATQPVTPVPSAINLTSDPTISGDVKENAHHPVNRLAAPNGTNALLVTPETHRLVANKPIDQVSPSKLSAVRTTTANILDEAIAHLISVEPKLKPVIKKHPCHIFSPEGLCEEIDPFKSLSTGIISQQVSGAAAKSIQAKFVALFNTDNSDATTHKFPTPSQICGCSIETLRTAGLSQRKAEYIQGLAQKFHSGELTTSMLLTASYEEVLEELIKVRGLGKWSVEMFAVFGLKRMDVFSTGDLGVQRGMAAFVGRDVNKLKGKGGKWKYMSEKEMEEISDKFKPYRSLFMWLTWHMADADISTFKE